MLHQVITRVSLDSFRRRSEGYKVVLMYPWTNYRNLFLSYFLQNAQEGLLYYRVPEKQEDIPSWLEDMLNEFEAVLGNFGANTRPLLPDTSPQELAQALAADLAAYSSDAIVLYLDELDNLPFDHSFKQFFIAFVQHLPENVQLALSSRMLTYQPWYDMVANGDAIVLGTEYRKNDVMFTVEPAPKPQLEVYALGRGYVLVNGREITNWDGALPRNLFFFFVDRPLVTRDEIFKTFWPKLNVKEATNVFHVTKRKITERISDKIGDGNNYELTQYSTGFYMPSDKLVRHYDVADFQEAMERAMMSTNDREEENLLRRAIELYKGPFLQTIDMPWTEERRKQLAELYAQALIGMGRIYKRNEDWQRALGFFSRSLKEIPNREDIHREVMRMYMKLGMREEAIRQYEHLQQYLHTTLGIDPSPETQQLFEEIRM